MKQWYGPVSYYELGRIYPRTRLRENWWNKDRRRRLTPALIPSVAPPPPTIFPVVLYFLGRDDTFLLAKGRDDTIGKFSGRDDTTQTATGVFSFDS